MEKKYVSFDEVHHIIYKICQSIPPNYFDLLLGISVGGLCPLALFSLELKNKNVATIAARSYEGQEQKKLVVYNIPDKQTIQNKTILLIDDILDSGMTITKIKSLLLDDLGAKDVKIACVYYKKQALMQPDYPGEETTLWIEFPWEKPLN